MEAANPSIQPAGRLRSLLAALPLRFGSTSSIRILLVLWVASGAICTGVWAISGHEGYWPVWVWLGGAVPAALGAGTGIALSFEKPSSRWAAAHGALALIAAAVVTGVWTLTGGGEWLAWSMLGIGSAFATHAALVFVERVPPLPRERALTERISSLERSRQGAVDLRSSELARLERNLHDGTQARLVAVAMLLGRAESKLAGSDQELVKLLGDARSETATAITELRELVNGIAPPLLVERGLPAAVEGLLLRSPLDATVDSRLTARLSPEAETAAYFVVAEAIANVLKHAPGSRVEISLSKAMDRLLVEIGDNGPGGADPLGAGLSGLRRRVEALEGTLGVASDENHGTNVVASIPCV